MSAAWRHERVTVRARLTSIPSDFLDVEHLDTRVVLERELAGGMDRLGITEIDVAEIRGRDRRLTRAIAAWAHRQTTDTGEPRFAGIRYYELPFADFPALSKPTRGLEPGPHHYEI